jgi:Amidase
MSEPADLSAVEARRLIGAKKLSPIELIASCLSRITATNGKINSVVAIDERVARDRAESLEAEVVRGGPLGVLRGLPVGIKDLEPVKGMRSTWGSLIFAEHIPDADAAMVADLRASGANIFCKTNTPEFGAGGNTRNRVYGATGNPFNPELRRPSPKPFAPRLLKKRSGSASTLGTSRKPIPISRVYTMSSKSTAASLTSRLIRTRSRATAIYSTATSSTIPSGDLGSRWRRSAAATCSSTS